MPIAAAAGVDGGRGMSPLLPFVTRRLYPLTDRLSRIPEDIPCLTF